MEVILTYFKTSGKYYSTGNYQTSYTMLHDIWEEVENFAKKGTLPDLVKGAKGYIISVDVPEHSCNHPRLVNVEEALLQSIENLD